MVTSIPEKKRKKKTMLKSLWLLMVPIEVDQQLSTAHLTMVFLKSLQK